MKKLGIALSQWPLFSRICFIKLHSIDSLCFLLFQNFDSSFFLFLKKKKNLLNFFFTSKICFYFEKLILILKFFWFWIFIYLIKHPLTRNSLCFSSSWFPQSLSSSSKKNYLLNFNKAFLWNFMSIFIIFQIFFLWNSNDYFIKFHVIFNDIPANILLHFNKYFIQFQILFYWISTNIL